MFIVSGISIWLVLQINVISQGGIQSYQSFIKRVCLGFNLYLWSFLKNFPCTLQQERKERANKIYEKRNCFSLSHFVWVCFGWVTDLYCGILRFAIQRHALCGTLDKKTIMRSLQHQSCWGSANIDEFMVLLAIQGTLHQSQSSVLDWLTGWPTDWLTDSTSKKWTICHMTDW